MAVGGAGGERATGQAVRAGNGRLVKRISAVLHLGEGLAAAAEAAAAAAAEAAAEASGGAGSGDGGDEVAEEVAECVICCDPLEVPHPRAPLPGRLSLCRITGLQL